MSGYIHYDIKEIMEQVIHDPSNPIPLEEWSEEQLKTINLMLQYAWNRGYKAAYQDMDE